MEFLVNSFLCVETVAIENGLILFGSSIYSHSSNEHFKTTSIKIYISHFVFLAHAKREVNLIRIINIIIKSLYTTH